MLAAVESPILFAESDDVIGDGFVQTGNVLQQWRTGRVQVDADLVHGGFDDEVQAFAQLFLGNVMLILADTNRFRIDLHQFGKRILQTARDADGTAFFDLEIREFLTSDIASGINRSARFIDDSVVDRIQHLLNLLGYE